MHKIKLCPDALSQQNDLATEWMKSQALKADLDRIFLDMCFGLIGKEEAEKKIQAVRNKHQAAGDKKLCQQ